MKISALLLLAAGSVSVAQTAPAPAAGASPVERLGTVSFPVSCAASQQQAFNRGVALLHDFWYIEAASQFKSIAEADPACSMAYWGEALSLFHQIWDRPSPETMRMGREEIDKARRHPAPTARERAYIDAAAIFYKPGPQDYIARVTAYSAAMRALYRDNPTDVDAGAFYALSLLASQLPDDDGLGPEHEAMQVLTPLFARYPDHPGVVHYIIHSCDNPDMAPEGLAAARHYGEIAPSGAHAAHMPGHIFARLGLWPEDIASQLAAIRASSDAEARHLSGIMDEPHSYDFLIYADLQSGRDADARAALAQASAVLDHIAAMPEMIGAHREGMAQYYRTELPIFFSLEMRDWDAVAALEPVPGAQPEYATMTWWARAIADGHLHRAAAAQNDLARYNQELAELRKGPKAYYAGFTGAKIENAEILAWTSFAAGRNDEALAAMRRAADLQDKVGQGEVDIPAREMLGDMLLETGRAPEALAEYRVALKLSPGRFNGLYHAGLAAEKSGNKAVAAGFYNQLLASTGNGSQSTRADLAHAREFIAANTPSAPQTAAR